MIHNSCPAYDDLLGNTREDEGLQLTAYENGRRNLRAFQEGVPRIRPQRDYRRGQDEEQGRQREVAELHDDIREDCG